MYEYLEIKTLKSNLSSYSTLHYITVLCTLYKCFYSPFDVLINCVSQNKRNAQLIWTIVIRSLIRSERRKRAEIRLCLLYSTVQKWVLLSKTKS